MSWAASKQLNPGLSQMSGKIQDIKTEVENLSVFKLPLDFTEQEKYLPLRELGLFVGSRSCKKSAKEITSPFSLPLLLLPPANLSGAGLEVSIVTQHH